MLVLLTVPELLERKGIGLTGGSKFAIPGKDTFGIATQTLSSIQRYPTPIMRPLSLKPPRPFKNLNAPYRMVFINEDSLEEVASFHLTKKSLYTLFSTIFLITILVTVAVLLFTPLKYYIPGYGSNTVRIQAMKLEQQVDSLNDLVGANTRNALRIQKLIAAKDAPERDTAMLKPELIRNVPESILPAAEDIRQQAGAAIQKEKHHGRRKK